MKQTFGYNGSPFFQAKPFSKLSFGKQEYQSQMHKKQHHNSHNDHQSQDSSQIDYTQIINQCLTDSQEWQNIPQIVQLTLKAFRDGLKNIQQKCIERCDQNKMIVNEQGLQIKKIQMNMSSKISKKQLTNQMRQFIKRESLMSMSQQKQLSIQSSGLDRTMIEQVKTIADALLSKKMEQFQQRLHQQRAQLIKQINKINDKIQEIAIKQLQTSAFKKKDHSKSFQSQNEQNFVKIDQILKEQKIINQKLEIFSKQLQNQKQTISGLHTYITDTYSPKQETDELLTQLRDQFENQMTKFRALLTKYKSKPINNADLQDYQNNVKVQAMIQEFMKKTKTQERKQQNQFKQKISKQLSNMATIVEVQKIIGNYQKQVMSNYKKISQKVKKLQKDVKPIGQSKISVAEQQVQRKTLTKRVMSKKKLSQSKISKTSKSPISHKQNSVSPLSHKCSVSTSKSPQKESKRKTSEYNNKSTQYKQQKKIKKEKKLKESLESLKKIQQFFVFKQKQLQVQIQSKLNSKIQKSQQKVSQNFQQNFKHFCKTIQESQDELKKQMKVFNKQQKSDINRALYTLTGQLILARFIYQGQCDKNDCIKWQQSANTMTQNFVLNVFNSKFKKPSFNERNKITIKETGIYEIKTGFYSTIQKQVNYQLLLNQQKIFEKKQIFQHPSRGVLFNQVILIPAGSKMSIRVLQRLQNFQAFIQLKRM